MPNPALGNTYAYQMNLNRIAALASKFKSRRQLQSYGQVPGDFRENRNIPPEQFDAMDQRNAAAQYPMPPRPPDTQVPQVPQDTRQPSAADYQNQMPPPPSMMPPMPQRMPDTSGQAKIDAGGQPPQQQAPNAEPTSEPSMPQDASNWDSTKKTDSFGSWFNKPQASDALTAFGAAMLKAPTFLQGIGDAATAVNNVDREYRMPTPQDIARAKIKGMLNSMAYGYRQRGYSPGVTGYANGQFWQSVNDKTTGQTSWRGPNGVIQDQPPDGFAEGKYSGMGQDAKNNVNSAQALVDQSNTAQTRLPAIDKQLDLLAGGAAGVNSDALTTMYKQFASTLGMPVGSVNPKDATEFAKLAAQAELDSAQSQRGLGALTEGERQILRDATVSSGSNPDAAKEVLMVSRQRAQRIIEERDAWNAELAQGADPRTFNSWSWKFQRQYDTDHPLSWGGQTPNKNDGTQPKQSGDSSLKKKYGLE